VFRILPILTRIWILVSVSLTNGSVSVSDLNRKNFFYIFIFLLITQKIIVMLFDGLIMLLYNLFTVKKNNKVIVDIFSMIFGWFFIKPDPVPFHWNRSGSLKWTDTHGSESEIPVLTIYFLSAIFSRSHVSIVHLNLCCPKLLFWRDIFFCFFICFHVTQCIFLKNIFNDILPGEQVCNTTKSE